MMYNPVIWANIILVTHFLFAMGIIVPIPFILIGDLLRWQWVRNFWFRNVHLAMIGIVVLETLLKISCPLTIWEQELRTLAGQSSYSSYFFAYWLDHLLYYNFPQWLFDVVYFAIGLLILALYIFIPPRRKQ